MNYENMLRALALSGAVSLSTLTGCNPSQQSAEKPTPIVTPTSNMIPPELGKMREARIPLMQDLMDKKRFSENFTLGEVEIRFAQENIPDTGTFNWTFRSSLGPDFYIPRSLLLLVQQMPFALSLDNAGKIIIASAGNPTNASPYGNYNIPSSEEIIRQSKGLTVSWKNRSAMSAGFHP